MSATIGIHVIGPRLGESVVIQLPDGGVGVIDSYAGGGSTSHPIVGFLRKRFPRLTRLHFLAVTHPHADHCHRCADLFDAFPPDDVWVFRPFPLEQLKHYLRALHSLGSCDQVEAAARLPSGQLVHSLLTFESRVRGRWRSTRQSPRYLEAGERFPLSGGSVMVTFLTPGTSQQFAYAEELNRCNRAITENGSRILATSDLPEPRHNLASGAILIEYGASRALLMADAEEELWAEWYQQSPKPLPPVQFLKVSHHGSANGYHQQLYSEVADPKRTVAVITPFQQGRVRLPSVDGVNSIRAHVRDLYCTNRDFAVDSTGLDWAPAMPRPRPRVPRHWFSELGATPGLAHLFVEGVLTTPLPSGRPRSLPVSWVMDAHKQPELWHLIRPQYRQPIPHLVPAEEYTVSAYLDDSGGHPRIEPGVGAGRLGV